MQQFCKACVSSVAQFDLCEVFFVLQLLASSCENHQNSSMKLMFGKNVYLKNKTKCVSPPPAQKQKGFKFACISCAFIILLCKCDIKWCTIKFYCLRKNGIQEGLLGKTFNVKAFSFFVSFELSVNQCSVKSTNITLFTTVVLSKQYFQKIKRLVILTACILIYKSGW